jgi:hypothetical protein
VTTNPVKKTKSNFGNLTKLVKDSAAKRRPPAAGKGRPKGSKNKTTALLKDAILMAANAAHKDGMVGYLQEQAIDSPTAWVRESFAPEEVKEDLRMMSAHISVALAF